MTPDEDEEELKRTLQALVGGAMPSPLAPTAPPLAAAAGATTRAVRPLAAQQPPELPEQQAPVDTSYADAPPPEPREKAPGLGLVGDEGAEWAALLDLALNRGRGVGQIVSAGVQQRGKREDQALDRQLKRAQIEATNRRSYGTSPEELALRAQSLGLQKERLGLTGDREARLVRETEARLKREREESDPNSETALRARKFLYENNMVKPGAIDGLSFKDMKARAPQIEQLTELFMAPEISSANARKVADAKAATIGAEHDLRGLSAETAATRAGAVAEATLPYQREVAREKAAGTQEGQGDYKERRLKYEQSRGFAKDLQNEIDLVGLATTIDDAGGVVPQSAFERFSGPMAAYGVPSDRLNATTAKFLMLEIWARAQSGAAISGTEDRRFELETGLTPLSPPEQIDAAYNNLLGLVQRRIRAGAVNNPTAIDVLYQSGAVPDPEAYLGLTRDQALTNAKPAVAPDVRPAPAVQMPVNNARQVAAAQEPPAPRAPIQAPPGQKPLTPEQQQRVDEMLQMTEDELRDFVGDEELPAGPRVPRDVRKKRKKLIDEEDLQGL